jgi:hypothetical protein
MVEVFGLKYSDKKRSGPQGDANGAEKFTGRLSSWVHGAGGGAYEIVEKALRWQYKSINSEQSTAPASGQA